MDPYVYKGGIRMRGRVELLTSRSAPTSAIGGLGTCRAASTGTRGRDVLSSSPDSDGAPLSRSWHVQHPRTCRVELPEMAEPLPSKPTAQPLLIDSICCSDSISTFSLTSNPTMKSTDQPLLQPVEFLSVCVIIIITH